MKQNMTFDELVSILKDLNDEVGSLSYYIFGLKYGDLLSDVNISKLITSAGLTASMAKELSKAKRLYEVIDQGDFGLSINSDKQPIKRKSKYALGSLQQISYGAPGTGKSHGIKEQTEGRVVVRTTFHPDSDYSTFVGAYKPTMKQVAVRDSAGHVVEEKDVEGKLQKVYEDRIVYEFVEQAFLKAYVKAWKRYAKAEEGRQAEEVFLVIEEINRGNCAQIFGDLFQLLDRGDNGFSEYPIVADKDLKNFLERAFEGLYFKVPPIAGMSAEKLGAMLRAGEILLLPSNLYIRATMNTSDQSLFPIDSAFKRRWEWKYIPIDTWKEPWHIVAEGVNYSWGSFLEIVNGRILKATTSEDKQLGFYFCKADDGAISAETFVSKVLFYLWSDVFKDYDEGESIFRDSEGAQLPFSAFFYPDGRINETTVAELLTALGVEHDENTQQA